MKKFADRFGLIFLMILVIIFSVVIGANEKGFRMEIITVLFIIELLYLLVKKIFCKEELIKNKFDLLLLLFFLVSFLPLIFKTYFSFQGTVELILKNIFIYSTYLCVRNTIKTEEQTNKLLYIIILCSFIILFVAIDRLYFNLFENVYEYLNIKYLNVKYLSGSFGYKNAFSIYFLLCLFISIYLYKNSKNKKGKILLAIYFILALLVIFLSKSRLVIIITIISLLIYIYFNDKRIIKNAKKYLFIFIFVLISFISLFFIFSNKSDSVKVNNKVFIINYDFQSFKNYDFTFYSKTNTKYEVVFEETLSDFNKKRNVFIARPIKENKKYKYTIKYRTNKNPYRLKMKFKDNKDSKIYNFNINDEEYILKYKYVPYKVSYYISLLNIKDYSIYQRLVYWNDSIKIFKKSPLIGLGGDSWNIGSLIVQRFDYKVKATHSYLFELLISYGVIGTILFIFMWLVFNKYIIKNLKNNNFLPLLMGIDIVIIHSLFFDFDLSFMLIYILIIILIGLLINKIEIKRINKYNKIINYSFILMISIISLLLSIDILYRKYDYSLFNRKYKKKYIENLIITKANSSDIKKEIKKFIKYEPYFYKNFMYKNYINNINLKKITQEELNKELKFINNNIYNNKYLYKFDYDSRIEYIKIISTFYNKLSRKKYDNKELLNNIVSLKKYIENDFKDFCKDLDNDSKTEFSTKYEYYKKYKNIISNLK